jgi:large subunit ribosomal protein L7/L12
MEIAVLVVVLIVGAVIMMVSYQNRVSRRRSEPQERERSIPHDRRQTQVSNRTKPMPKAPPLVHDPNGVSVYLQAIGSRKIEVIKVVREMTNLGLTEAKTLVDSAPVAVVSSVKREYAAWAIQQLTNAGATATTQAVDVVSRGVPSPSSNATQASFSSGETYQVILTQTGSKKIEVIKVIRAYTNLGLAEAKAMSEQFPSVILSQADASTAQRLLQDLQRAGAKADVRRN